MNSSQERNAGLAVRSDLRLVYALSVVIALLLAVASAAGLLQSTTVYPTEELRRSFVANDLVNLLVGLPILLGSLWLARRGKLIGLLFWPGALYYVVYNYIVYVLAMPLNLAFLLHLALLVLSIYTLAGLLASIDGQAVQRRLAGKVPERMAGGVLVGLGVLFLLRLIGVLAQAIAGQAPVADTELALHTADALVMPAWIIGGVLLWQRRTFGYVVGLGLLFQAATLFIGLIAVLLLQPLLGTAPLAPVDVVVVAILGLPCFIPLALWVRKVAAMRADGPDPKGFANPAGLS